MGFFKESHTAQSIISWYVNEYRQCLHGAVLFLGKAALSAIGRCSGVSQLYCRKSRFNGPLRPFPKIAKLAIINRIRNGIAQSCFCRAALSVEENTMQDVKCDSIKVVSSRM